MVGVRGCLPQDIRLLIVPEEPDEDLSRIAIVARRRKDLLERLVPQLRQKSPVARNAGFGKEVDGFNVPDDLLEPAEEPGAERWRLLHGADEEPDTDSLPAGGRFTGQGGRGFGHRSAKPPHDPDHALEPLAVRAGLV